MSTQHNRPAALPIVGIVPGDPNGIGAEVVLKALASEPLRQHCRPVVIGSASVMEQALKVTGLPLRLRALADLASLSGDPSVVDVLESAPFDAGAIHYGEDRKEAGAVSGAWLDHAERLALAGQLAATVMGPISAKAMDKAGTLASIASHRHENPAYLLLRSGPLLVAHLTDHVPLREVSGLITQASVSRLIETLARALAQWGLGSGRIAVAGFNPHAAGDEETGAIAPAVAAARAAGIEAEGPISPDTVFRHCIEGRYDAVVAMYHDQGHIAIKTWGFAGNSVVFLGSSYPQTTVAHGVAYDLAGTGTADCSMILNAIINAGSLAAGRGFQA
jgi:4-hydroxythreonine-4-phosphate dehydrogenase